MHILYTECAKIKKIIPAPKDSSKAEHGFRQYFYAFSERLKKLTDVLELLSAFLSGHIALV